MTLTEFYAEQSRLLDVIDEAFLQLSQARLALEQHNARLTIEYSDDGGLYLLDGCQVNWKKTS